MSDETRFRLAAIGCGRVFERYHLPAVRVSTDWSLVAVCDADVGRLEWAAQQVPEAARFESVSELLDREEIDAVLISSPPATHARLAAAALERGKHVLVEKPMAVRVSDADALIRISRVSGCCLAVGFNRRFRRTYVKAKLRLESLEPDEIRSIEHEFSADALRWSSIRGEMDDTQRLDYLLQDVASHQVDLVPWLLGRHVEAIRVIRSHVDSTSTILELEMALSGGVECRIFAKHRPSYEEHCIANTTKGGFVVYPAGIVGFRRHPGSWSRIRGRGLSMAELVLHRLTRQPNLTLQSFQTQLAAFAARVSGADDTHAGADGVSGRQAVAALEACRLSIQKEGLWQTVDTSHLEEGS